MLLTGSRAGFVLMALLALVLLPFREASAQAPGCEVVQVVDPLTNSVVVTIVCPGDGGPGGGGPPVATPVGGGSGGPSTSCRLIREGQEEQSWRGENGNQWWLLSVYECRTGPDTYEQTRWECVTNCPAGAPLRGGLGGGPVAAPIDWGDRLDDLLLEVEQDLVLPLPAVTGTWSLDDAAHPRDMAVVNAETWFWSATFEEISVSGSDGPLTVVITATPAGLTVDPGDGSERLDCPDGGTRYDPDEPYRDQAATPERASQSTCHHVYGTTSAEAPAGTFTIMASATWEVEYVYSGPISGSGDLGPDVVDGVPLELPVGEIQSYRGGDR